MACNGELETVDKAGIIERLEPATRSHFEAFHRCANCGRIYWEGSHHRRLPLVRNVRDLAADQPAAGGAAGEL